MKNGNISSSILLCLRVFRGRLAAISALILVGLVINTAFTLLDPLIMKLLIDKGLVQRNFGFFVTLSLASVTVGIVFRIASRVYELLSRKSQNHTTAILVSRMLQSYFSSDATKLADSSAGYFVSRIYDETTAASKAILTVAGGFCVSIATLFAALGLSLYLSWQLTLAVFCAVPLLTFIGRRFSSRVSYASQAATEEEARVREHLGRVVEAYRTARIFALQQFALQTTLERLRRYLDTAFEQTRVVKTYETASQILFSLNEALIFVGCGYAVATGRLTLGALFALMSSFSKVMTSGRAVVAQFPELLALLAQIQRLAEFESVTPAVEPSQPTANVVEMESVRLGYGEKLVLSDFSFAVLPAQKVLVLGANGTGKSTLAKAITGFLATNQGLVRRIPTDQISALLAPFSFLPGNLREHVKYQRLSRPKQALFDTLTEQFALVGKCESDIACSFSEGEKKKAQLIITLLKDANLYIFDEPLANLDVNMKEVAMRWIMKLTRGKALVVIMHGDEDYYRRFDHVLHLRTGEAKPIASTVARNEAPAAADPNMHPYLQSQETEPIRGTRGFISQSPAIASGAGIAQQGSTPPFQCSLWRRGQLLRDRRISVRFGLDQSTPAL